VYGIWYLGEQLVLLLEPAMLVVLAHQIVVEVRDVSAQLVQFRDEGTLPIADNIQPSALSSIPPAAQASTPIGQAGIYRVHSSGRYYPKPFRTIE
jgi:hypothetical protein